MKTTKITTLIMAAASMALQACVSDGTYTTYGTQYSSSVSGHYNTKPQCMPRREHHDHCRPVVHDMGPQYYRMQGVPRGTTVRNYTNAPIVVDIPATRYDRGNTEVIPASWD